MRALLACVVAVSSNLCFANPDIEIAIGATRATKNDNGYWHQEGFPYDVKLESPAFAIGFTDDFADQWRWRIGYEWLGRFTSNALAIASDANYNKATHGCNGECWPLSHWYGAGTVQGVYASVAHQLFEVGALPVSLEVGGDYYRSTWKVHVPDWRSSADAAPVDIHVEHRAQWQFTPQVGMVVGPIALTYRKNISASGDALPAIYTGSMWSIEYRLRFGI